MRTASRGLIAALALTPLLTACFVASGDSEAGASGDAGGGRLKVALAVPPVQALSPYSNDATVLSLTLSGILEFPRATAWSTGMLG